MVISAELCIHRCTASRPNPVRRPAENRSAQKRGFTFFFAAQPAEQSLVFADSPRATPLPQQKKTQPAKKNAADSKSSRQKKTAQTVPWGVRILVRSERQVREKKELGGGVQG